jgi:hypothetical protein
MSVNVKDVGFSFGILFDDLETQANKQGYTLGEDAEMLENLRHCLNVVRINRLLSEAQADKAYGRLIKLIVKSLEPLPQSQKE